MIARFALAFFLSAILTPVSLFAQTTPQGADPDCIEDSDCFDGFCNGEDRCIAGECQIVAPPLCAPVPEGSCYDLTLCDESSQQSCIFEPNDSNCEEGQFCNEGGECQDLGEPCSDDSDCFDGFCNGLDSCVEGFCRVISPPLCASPPEGGCYERFCNEETEEFCALRPDQSECASGEFCNPSGDCQLVDEGVPTLSEWGLLALTVSLLGMGILRLGYRAPAIQP